MKIEDAIKRYESWAEDDRIDLRIRKEHEQIAEWLKELKELKADKPQGKWIVRDDNTYCSECGASEDTFIYGSEYWHGLGLSHYCPNCSTKMKVVKR